MKFLVFISALALPVAAVAADRVALDSKVFVERQVTGKDGKPHTVREDPNLVVPGERLIFIVTYKNQGTSPADNFVVTNPIPNSVTFVASETPGADYSVDGGKSWGKLAALKVKGTNGALRPAQPADVTAIRWVLAKAIPAGAGGSMSFRGVVR
jgi:uncharacterized repeat protein (TIGR01451 family)